MIFSKTLDSIKGFYVTASLRQWYEWWIDSATHCMDRNFFNTTGPVHRLVRKVDKLSSGYKSYRKPPTISPLMYNTPPPPPRVQAPSCISPSPFRFRTVLSIPELACTKGELRYPLDSDFFPNFPNMFSNW